MNVLKLLAEMNAQRHAEWDRNAKVTIEYRGNELAGEVGELCNILKKMARERNGMVGSRATKEEAADELADVIICASLIAMDLGIDDVWYAVKRKFNKTSIKYGLKTMFTPEDP